MTLSELLLPEFDQEMADTRRTLERAPMERIDWKPHRKSPTLGWIATFLTVLPTWALSTINTDSFDVAPKEGSPKNSIAASSDELLGRFDTNVAAARAAIEQASDAHLMQACSLVSAGKSILTKPRIAILRSFVMNHIIHHRAQLCVYLRLNDIPAPGLYDPSADEG
jgi:uncharacterized damage-inducible protein DinB